MIRLILLLHGLLLNWHDRHARKMDEIIHKASEERKTMKPELYDNLVDSFYSHDKRCKELMRAIHQLENYIERKQGERNGESGAEKDRDK